VNRALQDRPELFAEGSPDEAASVTAELDALD
jgi:hypothetical protein